ncbi:hypothetical protein WNY59_00960 [Ahrensia kielensis]|jgi:hypothetical protein|uniref:DUF3329 domain-containing protein n=1 Tax=Ahrensia kielensis TaxID=76980 RepID=A0ABU9T2U7_9HYPH
MSKRPGFFDFDTPFFYPVWRRYAVVSVLFLWALFELYAGAVTWAIIFFGLGIIAAVKMYQTDWSAVKQDDLDDQEK